MARVWHISDVHLSFQQDGTIRKPMDQRKWSVGCSAYEGYLDKIKKFSDENIKEEDYVIVTGDILHDMRFEHAIYSFRWLRHNINGTIIICRGNHDKYWDVGYARAKYVIERFHILDEGETLALGPYMFGCYSDHSKKTENMQEEAPEYIKFGRTLAFNASQKKKKAVMLSHYPVSASTAEAMTKGNGLSAYLSGHVHCTSNVEGDSNGVSWKWYNFSAGLTDDKTFNGCYFSTGTTDVLLAKHGQIFKEIECLRTSSISKKEMNQFKGKAASAFRCESNMVTPFEKVDPFNDKNTVAGFICRKKGLTQGSLYITHVNGNPVDPQFIYGTPKLAYPYKDESDRREYISFEGAKNYFMAEKWNGMNVVFYKYQDAEGKEYITAKSKGTPFLSDTEVGNFLSLTKEAMEVSESWKRWEKEFKSKRGYQSISFELCGRKEPHLVKYDFDIDLKPLFVTYQHGRIKPIGENGTLYMDPSDIETRCRWTQCADFDANEQYREANGLKHKYEYEHFAVEGKVLYVLDDNGFVIDRTMYKIKPKDIEEVHWQSFNKDMRGRVVEAVKKIKMNDEKISGETLKQELDMGPKEWDKFGKQVIAFAKSEEADVRLRVVLMCGLPGSGKSTVANILAKKGWVRVNQDDLGSRGACKKVMENALKNGKNVVVDRCNFDVNQRKVWLDLAHENGVADVECFWIDIKPEHCIIRAGKRKDHPTIKDAETAERVINGMYNDFVAPETEEGFSKVTQFNRPASADTIAKVLVDG